MQFPLRLLTGVLLILAVSTASAQVRLPAIIGNNMVLQQQTRAGLWGWAGPNEKIYITASWNRQTDSTQSNGDGRWATSIQTPKAGGPYSITFRASNTVVVDNVLIGEVWLCSGQSNMEWSAMNNNRQAMEEAPRATNKQIRFFHIPRTTSDYPQDDLKASWVVCNPEDMKRFSAIGYFFGKKLNSELNLPVGLINSSWGGTPAEVWTPAPVISSDPVLAEAAAKLGPTPWGPYQPGKNYNAMIYPIRQFAIAGAIWYQGESNVSTAYGYTKLLEAMIRSWRADFDREFPFYYVQIAPYDYGQGDNGARLREAQSKLHLDRTGMVVISDLVDNIKDIHPQNKRDVADRLANRALAETYQHPSGPYQSPVYREMKIENDKVRIVFDHAESGLQSRNGPPSDFMICGDDNIYYPAQAKIDGSTVVVSAKEVKKPVAVRFGFSNTAMPNLFSKEGMPVNLFRTDE